MRICGRGLVWPNGWPAWECDMKQFRSYRSPRPARQQSESIFSKIHWFAIEHAVGILLVIVLLIVWRLLMA